MDTMTMGMGGGGIGANSNMLAALPEKLVKKVLTGVANNLTDSLSQHANQAVEQGVPWGHVMDELLKLAPTSMGLKAGMSLAGGGNTPPGGPPPGGQPPTGAVKNDQSVNQGVATQDNYNGMVPGQTPQQAPVDGNAILSQLLAAMQQGQSGGQQMQMPSFMGIKPSASNQALLTQSALGQQALAGKSPMQIGDLQKMIAGVGAKQLEAETVPLTAAEKVQKEYQDKQLSAAAATYKLEDAKAQMSALNQEQERATAEFNAMANSRGFLAKGMTPQSMIGQYRAKLDDIGNRMDEARNNLITLADQHPNLQGKTINSKALVGQTVGKYKITAVKN